MKTEKIYIANLKCGGCATTITNELSKLEGVQNVSVDKETDSVSINYENVNREIIINKLHDLGYPEATEENGLLLQLKSYASCMIGKVHNMTH
jgi:copper chaperone